MIVCCQDCYNALKESSFVAAEIWRGFCKAYVLSKGTFGLMEHRIPDQIASMRTLEQKGYIATCDMPIAIRVRVNGYMYEEDLHTFCIDRSFHQKKRAPSDE